MTIKRDRGELIAECNECGTTFPGGIEDNFQKFIQDMKKAGWVITKEYDEWIHLCPQCE